jgi:hypothetical protein
MRKWLARLSFSFLILAAVFAWEGHRASDRGVKPRYYYAIALIALGLGIMGIHERHRPPD